MAHTHAKMVRRCKAYEDLPNGRRPGQASHAIVQKEDYPKLYKMYQEGYLNSEIGARFGISGTHAGKLVRKYMASMEAGQ